MATFDRLEQPSASDILSKKRSLQSNGLNDNVRDPNLERNAFVKAGNTNIATRGNGLTDLTSSNALTSGNPIRQDGVNSFINLKAPGQQTVSMAPPAVAAKIPTIDDINQKTEAYNAQSASTNAQRVAKLQAERTQQRVNQLQVSSRPPSGYSSDDPNTFKRDLFSVGQGIKRSLTNTGNAFGAGIDASSEKLNEILDSRSAPFTNETLFSALSNAPKREPNAVERYFGLGGD